MHQKLLCDNHLLLGSNIQHNMKSERSICEVLQILGISLTDKAHLCDLFDKSKFRNVKDRYDSGEPNLFYF